MMLNENKERVKVTSKINIATYILLLFKSYDIISISNIISHTSNI